MILYVKPSDPPPILNNLFLYSFIMDYGATLSSTGPQIDYKYFDKYTRNYIILGNLKNSVILLCEQIQTQLRPMWLDCSAVANIPYPVLVRLGEIDCDSRNSNLLGEQIILSG